MTEFEKKIADKIEYSKTLAKSETRKEVKDAFKGKRVEEWTIMDVLDNFVLEEVINEIFGLDTFKDTVLDNLSYSIHWTRTPNEETDIIELNGNKSWCVDTDELDSMELFIELKDKKTANKAGFIRAKIDLKKKATTDRILYKFMKTSSKYEELTADEKDKISFKSGGWTALK